MPWHSGYQRKSDPNAARASARAARRAAGTIFIGVDGEGWTDELGVHRYAQLSVGTRTLFGAEHLDFLEIMDFLWDCHQDNPTAAYVGFYLGYDFSQWFRTLPEDRARVLYDATSRRRMLSGGNTVPFPVHYRGWEFDTLADKRFKLRQKGSDLPWMYICDTGPFFQTSFLTVIDPRSWPDGPVCSEDEYNVVLEGKSHRADDWTPQTWLAAEADLTRYNVLENVILGRVMERYEQGLLGCGVRLKRDQWYGPGAAAQAWMGNEGVDDRLTIEQSVPRDVLDFARESYYGGWFEVFVHGHVPGVAHEFDLNSAYPAAMSVMPNWSTCEYEWVDTASQEWMAPDTLMLLDCTTTGTDPVVGSMLHRRKDGTILRPSTTRGVRWAHEVRAGIAAGVIAPTGGVTLHRALAIRPTGQRSVFSEAIPTIYQKRLEVGKNTAHGKAYKLIYNSAYGKQAQSVGSPKFSNALSASFITSHCRTSILEAIASHPEGTSALLMVATDGVYFRSPHPSLPLSPGELGKWDHSEKHNMTIVMPGVYYDDASRASVRSGGYAKVKSRGIPAAAFAAAIERLDSAFSMLAQDPSAKENWPTLDIPIRFQVESPRAALHRGKWSKAGTVERDVERKLSTDPSSKRIGPGAQGAYLWADPLEPYVDGDLIRTRPYTVWGDGQSAPYSKRFGLEEDGRALGMSPDGPVAQELFLQMGES
jgi:DNA polymerase family B